MKVLKGISYGLISLGVAGIGGAVDLAESPARAISVLAVGLILLFLSRKGESYEKTVSTVSYHDASYSSCVGRS